MIGFSLEASALSTRLDWRLILYLLSFLRRFCSPFLKVLFWLMPFDCYFGPDLILHFILFASDVLQILFWSIFYFFFFYFRCFTDIILAHILHFIFFALEVLQILFQSIFYAKYIFIFCFWYLQVLFGPDIISKILFCVRYYADIILVQILFYILYFLLQICINIILVQKLFYRFASDILQILFWFRYYSADIRLIHISFYRIYFG